MKIRNLILPVLAAAGLLLATGCSTVESRIAQNQDFFNRLKPEQQELIKKGEVAIGFDAEMVRLAVGEPDYVRERTDAQGKSEVWGYTNYETYDGVVLYRGHYHRFWGGMRGRHGYFSYWEGPYMYPFFDAFPQRRARDYLKVTFRNGRVTEIDREVNEHDRRPHPRPTGAPSKAKPSA